MRCCQLCLLVSLHTHGLRILEPSNGTLAASPLVARAAHRRLSVDFRELAKLAAGDAAAGDEFGYSVAIDGNTVVVGAYGDDDAGSGSGSAYVFRTTDGGATYDEVAKLTASDAAAIDLFGRSVPIAGGTIVVGAHYEKGGFGAVYVFRTTDGGATYVEVAKLTAADYAHRDNFGSSVAIDGGVIVIGASHYEKGGSGAVYVFRTTNGGATYGQVAKLTASDAATYDFFGWSVAIDGATVVVGAYNDGNTGVSYGGSGSAYVFLTTNGGATYDQVAKLTAADAAANDYFGGSVAIDGATIVVGAIGAGTGGAVYIFRTTDGGVTYGQVAKLTADDAATDDYFGGSVAIDGDTIVVGADGDDDGGSSSGAVHVFRTTDGGATYDQVAKLTADDVSSYDYFGHSVAIAGGTVVVGAYRDDDTGGDSGSAYVFSSNVCPPGSFSDSGLLDGTGQCTVCAASTYQPLSGQSACDPCAAGRFSAEDGAVDCEICLAGRSQPASGQSECVACATGRFSAEENAVDCEACPAGRIQPASGQSECVLCAAGRFSVEGNNIDCEACPAGRSQPASGQSECVVCASGSFSAEDNAVDCEACPAGRIQPASGQSECVACDAGRFSAEDGAVDCEACPAGRSHPASGQSECSNIVCLPGTYAPAGSASCDHCPYNTYSSSTGAAACDPCPDDLKAGIGQSYCSRCLPGEAEHIADDGLSITCLKCQNGTFSPLGLYCEVPPLGWYTPDAVQSLPCAAGSFARETYATSCTECPAGRSQPASGQSECVTCLASTHQPLPGQLECASCAAGRFTADDFATECVECPAGRSQPASGQSECIDCVPETYQPKAGRLGCEPCAAFQLGRGSRSAVSCDYCGAGLYLADDASATDGKNCFD
ncbi:MAG: hypothetical protein CBB79_09255 [Synechococcus sp. TMED19]|nr:MAG: hypothetical protein CBB79_09255 [Synechococcus sp. TMED19]